MKLRSIPASTTSGEYRSPNGTGSHIFRVERQDTNDGPGGESQKWGTKLLQVDECSCDLFLDLLQRHVANGLDERGSHKQTQSSDMQYFGLSKESSGL